MIKVKDFAKCDVSENVAVVRPMSTDVISLSSEENVPAKIKPTSPTSPKISKQRKPRLARLTLPGISKKHISKTVLNFKNHKISEYFQSAKKDFKIEPKLLETETVADENESAAPSSAIKTRLRSAKRTLRLLSIEKNVVTSRKRNTTTDQPKVCEPADASAYFTTYDQAALPADDATVTPLPEPSPVPTNVEGDVPAIEESSSDRSVPSLFEIPEVRSNGETSAERQDELHTRSSKPPAKRKPQIVAAAKREMPKRGKPECPAYKIVEGTTFAVDAFRYGDIDGVQHYFLTHFHADHYIGLKKSFSHTLYLSRMTGRFVNEFFKIGFEQMQMFDLNEPVIVDNVEVTAIDANHCPGAVMFLYKLVSGKCILHTGDFRASPCMEEYPVFWNNDIHTIYLDTTYLSSQYDFGTQSECVAETLELARIFIEHCSTTTAKPLIVCGTYKVGKEMVWIRLAQELGFKVWMDDERRRVVDCMQNADITDLVTRRATDASIHLLPLMNVSYRFIADYVQQFDGAFSRVLGIRPSGWEKKSAKVNSKSVINVVGVQYSEHSSYNELERFVRFLQPKTVISTVPFNSKNVSKTPQVPSSWLNATLEPKKASYQRRIDDYMAKGSNRKKKPPRNKSQKTDCA